MLHLASAVQDMRNVMTWVFHGEWWNGGWGWIVERCSRRSMGIVIGIWEWVLALSCTRCVQGHDQGLHFLHLYWLIFVKHKHWTYISSLANTTQWCINCYYIYFSAEGKRLRKVKWLNQGNTAMSQDSYPDLWVPKPVQLTITRPRNGAQVYTIFFF